MSQGMANTNVINVPINVTSPYLLESPEVLSEVCERLLQLLLQLRHQIPVQFRDLRALVDRDVTMSRDALNEKHNSLKQQRKMQSKERRDAKLVAKANQLIAEYQVLISHLKSEFKSRSAAIEEVHFLFGPTHFKPKEEYVLILPSFSKRKMSNHTTDQSKNISRVVQHIFRSIVTHERLFSFFDKRLSKTNLYIGLKVKKDHPNTTSSSDWLTEHPNERQLDRKGVKVIFDLRPSSESDVVNPIPMELCTPIHQRSCQQEANVTPDVTFDCDQMIETPCVDSADFQQFTFDEMLPLHDQLRKHEIANDHSNCTWLVSYKMIKGMKTPVRKGS